MKKSILATLLVVGASMLLASCNKASANLKNPDDPIVVDKNGAKVEVENNAIKEIFNSIKLGDSYESGIKELLNEELAKAYVGNFQLNSEGKVIIEGLNENDDNAVLEFVKNHKFYWNWTSTGVSVIYEEEPSMANINDYKARIQHYKELVEKEVVTKLWSDANSSSYKKNNRFYEILFARNIYSQLYTVYGKNGSSIGTDVLYTVPDYKNETNKNISIENDFTFGKLIDRDYNVEDDYKRLIEGEDALLHLYHYVDYVNNTIIPGIVNNLLTQSYIYEKQYQSIGKTQSRKLNFIKIDDSTTNAEELLKLYVEKYLSKETESGVDYTPVVEAWNGIHYELNSENSTLDPETKTIAKELADTVFGAESTVIDSKFKTYIDGKTGEDYPYYDGSVYGSLIKDYSTLTNNPSTNNSTNYSKFTSLDNITYTPEEGLALSIENMKTTSYITNKWGGSSNFSDISDSTMTTKLFSYGLSSEFDTAHDSNTTFIVDGSYLKQFTKGGPTFLKKTSYSNPYDSVVWKSSNSYFIVEVVDQISPDTLASDTDVSKEEISRIESSAIDMAYDIASGSTYTNNALIYFLKQSNINYYDQDVYDYFKSTFPTLFE